MTDSTLIAQPIASGLFTDEAAPRLIGGRHRETGRIVFPCPQGTESQLYESTPLGRRGMLWSWTVQRFRPKNPPYIGPETFEPFAVGYVELPGETIVESRLTDVAFDALDIGMSMELTLVPLTADGATLTFAFRPVEEMFL
ncbi:MAG: DNA-binding protein [Sphingomonadales bacterium]|nr:DNA-binding protein [Sphingomonadales bacterium]